MNVDVILGILLSACLVAQPAISMMPPDNSPIAAPTVCALHSEAMELPALSARFSLFPRRSWYRLLTLIHRPASWTAPGILEPARALPLATRWSAGTERLTFHTVPQRTAVRRRRRSGVTRLSIYRARYLLKFFGVVKRPAPLLEHPELNDFLSTELGHPFRLFLKDERINPTGSFKDLSPIRLYHRVMVNNVPQRVEAVSTGNHGLAAAHAVSVVQQKFPALRGLIKAVITLGKGVLPHKVEAIRREGAMVRDHAPDGHTIESYAAGQNVVERIVGASNGHVIEIPHADPFVVSGYATRAAELLRQLPGVGVSPRTLHPGELVQLYPLGSGGFFAGALEARTRVPAIESYALAAEPADMTYETFKRGHIVRREIPSSDRIAVDGNMATPDPFAVPLILDMAKGALKVLDEDALYGAGLLAHFGMEAEATSGLAIAALLLHSDLFVHARYAVAPLTSRNLSPQSRGRLAALGGNLDGLRAYFAHRSRQIRAGLAEAA